MTSRDYMRHDWDGGGGGPRSTFWATTPATKGLLIALGVVHLVVVMSLRWGPELYLALSLNPEAVLQRFYVWQLVTATLVHDPYGIMHILFNGLIIWFFGRPVEMRLGTRRFLIFCLAAAVTASLAYLLLAVIESDVRPMVGASGACMGLLILVALWEPNQIVYAMMVLPVRMWVLAVILVFFDLIGAINSSGGGGVAHSAHLGGALYGWLFYRYGGGLEKIFGAIDRYADAHKEKRRQTRDRRDAEMRKEVDRILDKVNREGMAALSDQERRFLKEASGKLRK